MKRLVSLLAFVALPVLAQTSQPLVSVGGAIKTIPAGNGLQIPSMAGSGARCVQADALGTLTVAAGPCASGGSGSVTSVAVSGGTTGLTTTGGPITTSGTITLGGTLGVANGGTGSTTASGARTNLGVAIGSDVQAYSAKLGAYAGGDTPSAFTLGIVDSADAAAWRTALGVSTGSGTVTSVDASGGTTGLSFTGGPVTTSGTLTLGGTLGVANGGTGSTTASTARTALGLGNVDNTSDASKPVSTAQQTALDLKANIATPVFTNTIGISNATGNAVINIDRPAGQGGYLVFRSGTAQRWRFNVDGGAESGGNAGSDLVLAAVADGGSTIGYPILIERSSLLTTFVATATPSLTVTGTGGNIFSGTYTPTLTSVANVASRAAYSAQYMRVGNSVTVSGKIDLTPTAGATLTRVGVSLPVASNLANQNELAGTAAEATNAVSYPGAMVGDATNDRAELNIYSATTTARGVFFTFTYRVQ